MIEESLKVLKRNKDIAPLIKKYGVPDLKRGTNPFQALVRSIVYQQLSGKAAATIFARFVALFPATRFPTPQQVKATPVAKLRTAGLSQQKATYLKDLALKFTDGTINPRTLHRKTSAELIEHLIEVKGIGEWTVHMFLIFTLNRPDILPTGDLGIRKGFQRLYNLPELPNKKQMEELATPWRAYASVVSWYLWRLADEGNTSRPTPAPNKLSKKTLGYASV